MKKAKFLQDAKLDPARFYRHPADVMRDRRLTDDDRRQIIAAWERNTKTQDQDGSATGAEEQLSQLRELRERLEPHFPIGETGPEQGDATTV
jgi:hypothetical protein